MLTLVPTALLVPLAVGAAWRGARLVITGFRMADDLSGPLCLVRGIRAVTIAIGLAALSGGLVLPSAGLVWFGTVFLAEELYETGLLLLVLKAGLRAETPPVSG